jgi:Rap1a immunity proteins
MFPPVVSPPWQLAWPIYLLCRGHREESSLGPAAPGGRGKGGGKLGISGNDLLEFCQAGEPGPDNPARAFCLGYIAGALEGWHHATIMHRGAPSLCNGQRLTIQQIANISIIYLREHPELRPLNASSILGLLFVDKFDCDLNQASNVKPQNPLEPGKNPVDERKPPRHP